MAAKPYYIAIASTTVETGNPEAELKPALDLLGPVIEKYVPKSGLLEEIEYCVLPGGYSRFPVMGMIEGFFWV